MSHLLGIPEVRAPEASTIRKETGRIAKGLPHKLEARTAPNVELDGNSPLGSRCLICPNFPKRNFLPTGWLELFDDCVEVSER
ncbi:hypothetical protein TNCV_1758201 [Trichonephila clavipes]|nr:hypothetical protein TNCV_1758201 [Trichonephila clavipes]